MSRQARGWNKIENSLPLELLRSKEKIERLYNSLEAFIHNSAEWNFSRLNTEWRNIEREIKALSTQKILITESPLTTFLIDVHQNHGQKVYNGTLKYLLYYNQNHTFSSPEELTGAFLAYEFKYQENSIKNRRRQEKSSITRLKNSFEKHFSDTNHVLAEQFASSQQKVQEISQEFDDLVEEKKVEFQSWFSKTEEEFNKFSEGAVKSISDNEELYKEKLKLEAPATYWQKRAENLRAEGNNWLFALLISCAVGVVALGLVLYLISDGTLKELFDGTGSAIRWSIVFITFVSFLAFSIRTFAKLTFSSFHLVRDAEEREQLAYVYLALKKEKNIDDTERHLVMQSIFSRADSGLLKDDTSPTMPGNIVDKFIAKN